MGTNFYLVKRCSCGEAIVGDKIHLGKSSAGWSFSFRGYRGPYNPYQVENIQEWKDLIEQNCYELEDENGNKWDIDEFYKISIGKAQKMIDNGKIPRYHAKEFWEDSQMIDGHSFSFGEFS
jgi:hypothetical protein